MSSEGVFTVRTDAEKLKALDDLAAQQDRSRNYLVNEALDRYLAYDRWFRAEVEKGLEDVREGRLVAHEEIKRKWEMKRADLLE